MDIALSVLAAPEHRPDFHGRRHGHRLRPRRRRLVQEVLPRYRVERPSEGAPIDPARCFGGEKAAYWLEIGFGAGEHLAAQAAANPDVGIIGCEPFINGVAALLARLEEKGLENIRLWDDDVRPLLAGLPESVFSRVFLLYPDPWPKRRHHKRRFVTAENLDALARIMTDGAELRFASDHMGYVAWTLEALRRHPQFEWTARRPGDWRERPADAVETRYEAKALAAGRPCVHLRFRRLAR